jgi:CarboxypepD_reg-like domain
MRATLICLCLLAFCFVHGQNNISGKVVQEKTLEPIAGASIFISNSTKGTVSKADGSFELTDVPAGNHELVISFVGHHTLVHAYTAAQLPLKLQIQLKPKVTELATVIVEPDEADGWRRWGKFFTENFIGTSDDAFDCKLKNPEVLRFRFSKKKNTLTVVADEPLIIENRSLGYKLQYQLEEFHYDFSGRFLLYLGYTLFEDLPSDREKIKKRWAGNRLRAYYGSIQHFMKSLYNNQLAEQGYEVRRLIKTPNLEKQRVRALYKARLQEQREKGGVVVMNMGDSSDYYSNILSQPDEFETMLPHVLAADSLVTNPGGTERLLFFQDHLHITYKKEPEEVNYVRAFMMVRGSHHQRSTVFLPNEHPITIDSNGNHSPLLEIISYGYWSWSEKIASMLPLDYEVKK